jgi:hypothetical protein
MPFYPEQLEAVKLRIKNDLKMLELYGSVKLYLCWYDQFLISDSEWRGIYPCSDQYVHLSDVLNIVNEVMTKPYIVRHNIICVGPIPGYMIAQSEAQDECEKYLEVCLVL